MDPWATDHWNELDHQPKLPQEPQPKQVLQPHPEPSPPIPLLPQSELNWHSDPTLSLPNWDSPSESDSTIPSSSSTTDQPAFSSSFASSSALHSVPDPVSTPIWSNTDLTESTQKPSTADDLPTLQDGQTVHQTFDSNSFPQPSPLTLNLSQSPTDSDHSLFKTPQGSVHNWPDSSSSPVQLPSQEPPSTPVQLELSPAHSHQPETKPDLDNDDDRWGTFTQTPVLPSSSALPLSNPPDMPPQSPIQAGWDADTGFGGWDSHANIDGVTLSLGASVGQDDEERRSEKGWESPTLDARLDQSQDGEEEQPVEDAWADTKPRDVHEVPPDIVGKHQLAAQKWAQDQWPVQEESFLPPGKAAMPLDLSSALSPGGELAGTLAELTQDPLPETSATRTQLLFQNSATAEAFQHAISKTASAAANVLKSANRSRRLFPMGAPSGPSPLQDAASLPASGQPTADDAIWNDFSALEVPHHPHDADSDVFGLYESQKTVQQQQSKRSSFFGLWPAKSPTPTNTPATLLTKKAEDGRIGSPPVAGLAVTPKQSLSLSRDASSSRNTSPSAGPTPSSIGPSESPQDPPPSRISRLFGRFGTRPTHSSLSSPAMPSFNDDLTTAATELDEREASYLDAAQTVPVEPPAGPYDAVPPTRGLKLDLAPPRPVEAGSDLLDLLADPAPPVPSPINRRHTREMSVTRPRPGVTTDPFDFFGTPSTFAAPAQPTRRHVSGSPPGADVPGGRRMSLLDALSGGSAGLVSLSQQTHGTGSSSRTHTLSSASQPTDDLDTLFAHFQSSVACSPPVQRSSGVPPKAAAGTGAGGKRAQGLACGTGPTTVRMASRGGAGTGRVPVLAPPPGASSVPLIPPPQRIQEHLGGHNRPARKTSGQQVRFEEAASVDQGAAYSIMFGGGVSGGPHHYSNSSNSHRNPGGSSSGMTHNSNTGSAAAAAGGGGGGLSKQDLSFFDSLM